MNASMAWLELHLKTNKVHKPVKNWINQDINLLSIICKILIIPFTADDDESLLACEPMRPVGRVGDKNEQDNGPEGTECTNDDKLPLPGRKTSYRSV